MRFPTKALLIAALAAASHSYAHSLPPEPIPAVLLRVSADALVPTQDTGEWARAGLGGFIIDGLLPATPKPAEAPAQPDDPLSALTATIQRLRAAGLSDNFALLALDPEQAYFTDPTQRERILDQAARLAQTAHRTGLRGLAIDTCSSSLSYSYAWDGYDHQDIDIKQLRSSANRFGQGIPSTVYPLFPSAHLLIIVDDVLQSGPFWLPMFSGILEALSAHQDATVHLLTRETCLETDPQRLAHRYDLIQRFLRLHLTPSAWEAWRSKGSLALGCAPIALSRSADKTLVSQSTLSPEAFRTQLAAAKLLSPRYLWLDIAPVAPSGSPETRYELTTPLDRFTRVGLLPTEAGPAWVLRSDKGAAAAFLEGMRRPLAPTGCRDVISITNLAAGEKQHRQVKEGDSLGPFDAPVLLEGLGIPQWVVPACFCMDSDQPLRPGPDSTDLRFGLTNRTGLALRGALHASADNTGTRCSVKPSVVDVDLAPGESLAVRGALRGTLRPGDRIDISLRFMTLGPDSVPVTTASRTYSFPVQPALLWSHALRGPITASSLTVGSGVVVASSAGELTLVSHDGNPKWQRSFPARFDLPPAVARHWSGQDLILTLDHRGNLCALQPNGQTKWQTPLAEGPGKTGPLPCNLARFPGDEIVVALEDGSARALFSNAQPYWRHACRGVDPRIAAADFDGDGFDEIVVTTTVNPTGSPSHTVVTCLDSDGKPLWANPLDSVADCPPVVADLDFDGLPEVVTGTRIGDLAAWHGQDGTVQQRLNLSPPQTIRGITAYALQNQTETRLLVACDRTLLCLTADFELLWQSEAPCAAAPAVTSTTDNPRILVPTTDGALLCLDSAGQHLWIDHSSASFLPASPLLADVDNDGFAECLFGSTDRLIRCLEMYE